MEVDKHMLNIEGLQPVSWEQFQAIEQRRFEECSVTPDLENDVVVGSDMVVWSGTLISVYKTAGWYQYPAAYSASALEQMLGALPSQSHTTFLLDRRGIPWPASMLNDRSA
jgi:hypothetical protein